MGYFAKSPIPANYRYDSEPTAGTYQQHAPTQSPLQAKNLKRRSRYDTTQAVKFASGTGGAAEGALKTVARDITNARLNSEVEKYLQNHIGPIVDGVNKFYTPEQIKGLESDPLIIGFPEIPRGIVVSGEIEVGEAFGAMGSLLRFGKATVRAEFEATLSVDAQAMLTSRNGTAFMDVYAEAKGSAAHEATASIVVGAPGRELKVYEAPPIQDAYEVRALLGPIRVE